MEDLDRVLDRDDVLPARPVDEVDHRRERRRLPGAGRACDEDQAAVPLGEPLHSGRQLELRERGHGLRDHAEREGGRAALAERVNAEPWEVLALVGDVEVAAREEGCEPCRRGGADGVERGRESGLVERRPVLHRKEDAVAPKDRRLANLQVDVAGAELDGAPKECVQFHPARLASAAAGSFFRPVEEPSGRPRRGRRPAPRAA